MAKLMNFQIDDELAAQVDAACTARSVTKSQIIRRLLREWISRPEDEGLAAQVARIEADVQGLRAVIAETRVTWEAEVQHALDEFAVGVAEGDMSHAAAAMRRAFAYSRLSEDGGAG